MNSISRRNALGLLGGIAAGFVLDPERLLWKRGAKMVSVPKNTVNFSALEEYTRSLESWFPVDTRQWAKAFYRMPHIGLHQTPSHQWRDGSDDPLFDLGAIERGIMAIPSPVNLPFIPVSSCGMPEYLDGVPFNYDLAQDIGRREGWLDGNTAATSVGSFAGEPRYLPYNIFSPKYFGKAPFIGPHV